MARRVPALVKPELLLWARESAGIRSLDEAAAIVGIDSLTLQEWENGHESPSIAELRKLGEIYKRPIAVFFLPEPPHRFDAQREFRRLAGTPPETASTELLATLRWALFLRDAALELQQLRGEEESPSIGKPLHPQTNTEEAGSTIRKILGISWHEQCGWKDPYLALRTWRTAIEARGVLVLQTSDVELQEMRGTCIPEKPIPVILLNAKDAPHARVFTLLHEFAHILLCLGGHNTSKMVGERAPEEQPLEVSSNAFAAAALMPEKEFRDIASAYQSASQGDDTNLRALANRIKVSPESILRRMTTLKMATDQTYRRKRNAWGTTLWYTSTSSNKGGPTIGVKALAKEGRKFTGMVLDAYDQRLINTNRASDYLGLKPQHFSNLRRELTFKSEIFSE